MKILFINASLRLGSRTKYLPVGIASVMTYVRQYGHEFDLLDIDINDLSDTEVDSFLATHTYDVVLTGSIVTHYKWMKWLTRTVKKYSPETFIIVGNSVGGSAPEVFLRNSIANAVVIGEGEVTALELLNALRDKKPWQQTPGIAYLDEKRQFKQTPRRKAIKVDDLPFIDWTPFDVEAYFKRSYTEATGLIFDQGQIPRVMPVTTARGCAFRCSFCHFVFWEDPYRFRSPKRVLAEIKHNIEKYNANYFNFWDDLSFSTLEQIEAMCDAILASKLDFYWSCAIRVDLFGNPKEPLEKRMRVARKLKEARCLNTGFSLESGDENILKMMNKHIAPEYFKETVRILNELKINFSNSVVFGYPIETEETVQKTFDMCLEAKIYPSIGFLLPLPHTGMYTYAKEHGFITDEDKYLDSITERQDICLNMTRMSNDAIMAAITKGAEKLNQALELSLSKDRLIRTGGYNYHRKTTKNNPLPPVDTENMKRIPNDVSFNYSQAIFSLDEKIDSEKK